MKGWSQAEISTLGLRIAIRKIHPSPPQLCIYDNFHGQENSVVKVYNSPYGASLLIIGRMKLRSSECRWNSYALCCCTLRVHCCISLAKVGIFLKISNFFATIFRHKNNRRVLIFTVVLLFFIIARDDFYFKKNISRLFFAVFYICFYWKVFFWILLTQICALRVLFFIPLLQKWLIWSK